ncbi:MAG: hypothetical protein EA402_06470 [Planctomycetota bacterium]|nr:MAG: hypothetical protein EA402_06470 [Planctomycetota bacterium]
MNEPNPWRFAGLQQAQRRDIRALSLWQRLLLHDELLANAQLISGDQLHQRQPDRRHLCQAMANHAPAQTELQG